MAIPSSCPPPDAAVKSRPTSRAPGPTIGRARSALTTPTMPPTCSIRVTCTGTTTAIATAVKPSVLCACRRFGAALCEVCTTIRGGVHWGEAPNRTKSKRLNLSRLLCHSWSIADSNRLPQHCQCCALPDELMPRFAVAKVMPIFELANFWRKKMVDEGKTVLF